MGAHRYVDMSLDERMQHAAEAMWMHPHNWATMALDYNIGQPCYLVDSGVA